MIMTPFTLLAVLFATAAAFSGNTGREIAAAGNKPAVGEARSSSMLSRTAFVTGMAGAVLAGAPSMAFAKKAKDDQCPCEEKQNKSECMSLCLYECIKHGGTKEECLDDCNRQCKTARGQRTMATPVTVKGVDYK